MTDNWNEGLVKGLVKCLLSDEQIHLLMTKVTAA